MNLAVLTLIPSRYGRIVRRAWIDEATKKFIVWANARFVPLTVKLDTIEGDFRKVEAKSQINFSSATKPQQQLRSSDIDTLRLQGTPYDHYKIFCKLLGRYERYKPIVNLRYAITHFLGNVAEAEQPFGRGKFI